MANAAWTVTAVVMVCALMPGICAAAASNTGVDVVLHVTNYERISGPELIDAEQEVVKVYSKIGVRLAWAGGVASGAVPDGARHVDVVILTADMADRKQPNAQAFGQASHETGRAYIYYTRAMAFATKTASHPKLVLGLVIAHEIGHVLLPEYSHAPSGLMRAEWDGRIVTIPGFLPTQTQTIRALLGIEN